MASRVVAPSFVVVGTDLHIRSAGAAGDVRNLHVVEDVCIGRRVGPEIISGAVIVLEDCGVEAELGRLNVVDAFKEGSGGKRTSGQRSGPDSPI